MSDAKPCGNGLETTSAKMELFPLGRPEIRLSQVKQGAVAQTALVKLAVASLLNDVLRK
jgi:hypothetical protein